MDLRCDAITLKGWELDGGETAIGVVDLDGVQAEDGWLRRLYWRGSFRARSLGLHLTVD